MSGREGTFVFTTEGMALSAIELGAAAAKRHAEQRRPEESRHREERREPRRMLGAQALIECLKAEGVEYIFGHPGGAVLHLYDALYDSGLNTVLCRHEQGAAHMADGYARATGRPGVCLATSGPGATNLVTGLATAFMDSIPLVAITGNVPRALIGRDAFQEADITGITLPVTKHNFLVRSARELPHAYPGRVSHRHHRPSRPGAGGHSQRRGRGGAGLRVSRSGGLAGIQADVQRPHPPNSRGGQGHRRRETSPPVRGRRRHRVGRA